MIQNWVSQVFWVVCTIEMLIQFGIKNCRLKVDIILNSYVNIFDSSCVIFWAEAVRIIPGQTC